MTLHSGFDVLESERRIRNSGVKVLNLQTSKILETLTSHLCCLLLPLQQLSDHSFAAANKNPPHEDPPQRGLYSVSTESDDHKLADKSGQHGEWMRRRGDA